MSLPPAIARTLVDHGFAPDVRAGVAELYRFLGPASVEALIDITEGRGREPAQIVREDLAVVRSIVGARFLRAHHGSWKDGIPTPAFWRDRRMTTSVTGMAVPLGDLEDESSPFASRVAAAVRQATGPDQPRPQGLLVMSKGGHYGNRAGDVSFDLVPSDLDMALALNESLGQQHTLPGSIGEASGTIEESGVALLWEVQPNVYKPSAERNQSANKAWRKHRNWHLVTATAAFAWLEQNGYDAHVLKGSALSLAHEVNPDKPVTPEIEAFHERTVASVLRSLGLEAVELEAGAAEPPVREIVEHVFSHHVDGRPTSDFVRRVVRRETAA